MYRINNGHSTVDKIVKPLKSITRRLVLIISFLIKDASTWPDFQKRNEH